MPAPSRNSIRLVIQAVSQPPAAPGYRVVAYGDRPELRLRPVLFPSREKLVARLHAAIPEFDEALLMESNGSTHIVFAASMELNPEQLAALGLTR